MAKRNILDPKLAKVNGQDASLVKDVQDRLEEIHNELYAAAVNDRDAKLTWASKWEEFSPNLNEGKLVLIPFCGEKECEEKIKDKSKEEAAEVEVVGGLKMGDKSLC